MMDIHSLKKLFRLAFDHGCLSQTPPTADKVVNNSPFMPYDAKNFGPVYKDGHEVKRDNVRTTYYADETDGSIWHGMPTSTGTMFNTHDPTKVALNQSLLKQFPPGSFIKITNGEKELIAEVDDIKGYGGIDLSAAGAALLGIRDVGRVTVQLMKPAGCEDVNLSRKGHYLDRCYEDEIRLVFTDKSSAFNGRPNRERLLPFYWNLWKIADRIKSLGLNDEMTRIKAFAEYVNETGWPVRHYAISIGPFASEEEAVSYAGEYANFCGRFECSPEEAAEIAWQAGTIYLYRRKWTNPHDSKTARFHGDAKEQLVVTQFKGLPLPEDAPNVYFISNDDPASLKPWLALGSVYLKDGIAVLIPSKK